MFDTFAFKGMQRGGEYITRVWDLRLATPSMFTRLDLDFFIWASSL